MTLPSTRLGTLCVSRFILGSNPFSGFSHQGHEADREMKRYYTVARIKEVLHAAERLGVNTLCGRADHHMVRLLQEYWDEGGEIQWLAQTCPELGPIERGVANALGGGARACYIHGGVMDNLVGSGDVASIEPAIRLIRSAGLPAGIAGHTPEVFRWAETNLDVDFYMCCYYNPIPRAANPQHVAGLQEAYRETDRDAMTALIGTLSRPVIHYKVMAAGRNNPAEAFARVRRHLRDQDAVCVGIYPPHGDRILEDDIRLAFPEELEAAG